MEKTILESAKTFLAEHYAAQRTADGKPTQAADIAGFTQCLVNVSNFAKLQLETEVLKLYADIDERDLFKKTRWLGAEGIKYNWGRIEGCLYVLTQENPRPPMKK